MITDLLDRWLGERLPEAARGWLGQRLARVTAGDTGELFLAFGLASRKAGKADLALPPTELADAGRARPGWNPSAWTVEQAARTRLLLALPAPDAEALVGVLDRLFAAGEVGELVALYQALPLLAFPEAHVWRARECVRTNMRSVFAALAHRNPYPAERLDEPSWNQFILKAVFIGLPLDPVSGLDARANATLAIMLADYVRERWAASRAVTPEIWRLIGPFAQGSALDDLCAAYAGGTPNDRRAAALALAACPDPRAAAALGANAPLAAQARCGRLSWAEVARDLERS